MVEIAGRASKQTKEKQVQDSAELQRRQARGLQVGQIWKSKDPREHRNARTLTITEVGSPFVWAQSKMSKSDTGRRVRILQARFLSSIRHYELVKDVAEAGS